MERPFQSPASVGDIQDTGIQFSKDEWVSASLGTESSRHVSLFSRASPGLLCPALGGPRPQAQNQRVGAAQLEIASSLTAPTCSPALGVQRPWGAGRRRGGGAPAARADWGRGAQRGLGWSGSPLPSAPRPLGRAPPPARPLSPPQPSLHPAIPPSLLLLFLGEALLQQPGSMAAVETRVCETDGCSSEAKLQCPTCIKLGIQGSYFCSQVDARYPAAVPRPPDPLPFPLRQPSRQVATRSSSSPGRLAGCASSPHPQRRRPLSPPGVLGPSGPGRAGRTGGGARSVRAMWAGSGSGLVQGGPAARGRRV